MKKKIVSVILILTIVLSSVELSKKEAEAAWMIPFIPAIAEALVSLSEVLLLSSATILTFSAVTESFDMSDVDYIAGKLDTATDAAGDWWRDIKNHSYRIDNPSVSLNDDIAAGKTISWDEYYEAEFNVGGGPTPDPEKPRKSKKIDVTVPVIQGIQNAIKSVRGVDDIKKSGSPNDIVRGIIKQYCPNASISANFNYKYVLVLISYQGYEQIPNIRVWVNGSTPMQIVDYTDKYSIESVDYSSMYDYSANSYSEGTGVSRSILDVNKTKGIDYLYNKILYSNYKIPTISGATYDTAYQQNFLPASQFHNVDLSNGFTITPTKELRDTITNAPQPVKTSDDIAKLLSDSDKLARAKGGQVINVDIDGNTSVQPEEPNNQSIIDTIKNWVGNPLQGIWDFLKDILNKILSAIKEIPDLFRGFIEWIQNAWNDISDLPGQIGQSIKAVAIELFVPTSISLDNFKNQAEQIIETKTGILSYPLVLLVKLSEFVFTMDSRDCILTFPKLQYKGYVLCEKHTLNLTELVKGDEFKDIYNIYIIVTDFIMIMLVVYFGSRKIDSIMKGE